jgi:hypothetical protein
MGSRHGKVMKPAAYQNLIFLGTQQLIVRHGHVVVGIWVSESRGAVWNDGRGLRDAGI